MARPRKKRILARRSRLSWPKLEEVGSSTAMAFIGKLGEQTYTVEIEEVEKSLYRDAVDGNEFVVYDRKRGASNYSLMVDNGSFEVEVGVLDGEYRVQVV